MHQLTCGWRTASYARSASGAAPCSAAGQHFARQAGIVGGALLWTAWHTFLRRLRLDSDLLHHSISYWTACAPWAEFGLRGCRRRCSLRRQTQLRSMPHSARLTDCAAQLDCVLHCLVGALHTGRQGQSSACSNQLASNRFDARRLSF